MNGRPAPISVISVICFDSLVGAMASNKSTSLSPLTLICPVCESIINLPPEPPTMSYVSPEAEPLSAVAETGGPTL